MWAPATGDTSLLFLEHTRHATHLRASTRAGPSAKTASSPESRSAPSFFTRLFFTRRLLGEDLPATLPKTPSPPPSHPHQHFPAPFFSSAPIRTQHTTDFTFHYVIFSLLRRHGFSTRAAVSSVCSFAVSPVPLEQCLAQNVFANAWKGGGEGGKE